MSIIFFSRGVDCLTIRNVALVFDVGSMQQPFTKIILHIFQDSVFVMLWKSYQITGKQFKFPLSFVKMWQKVFLFRKFVPSLLNLNGVCTWKVENRKIEGYLGHLKRQEYFYCANWRRFNKNLSVRSNCHQIIGNLAKKSHLSDKLPVSTFKEVKLNLDYKYRLEKLTESFEGPRGAQNDLPKYFEKCDEEKDLQGQYFITKLTESCHFLCFGH